MYKTVLLALTLCVLFTIKTGRCEVYNLHRQKVAERRQELQMLGKLVILV